RASGGAMAPSIRIVSHSTGSRVSPSLQRASLSNRIAAAVCRQRNAPNRSRTRYSGRPSIVEAGGSLIVLTTGTGALCQSSGFSSPWSWIARSPHASTTDFTWPLGWSQKTPTGVTNGGSQRTIDATCSGVTNRGVFSTKMKPSASAPACTAIRASSRLVMPQILTRIIVEWVGRDAPPISPPIRAAPDSASPISRPIRAAPDSLGVSNPGSGQGQLADLGADVGRAHQALADQHRVRAGVDHAAHVAGREEPALADDERAGRDLWQQ